MTLRTYAARTLADYQRAGNRTPTKVTLSHAFSKALAEELKQDGIDPDKMNILFGAKVTTTYEPDLKWS